MKSPSLHPEIGRVFGIDWKPADEVSIAHGSWRDAPGQRHRVHVLLRLADGKSETGHNLSMSRVRARQIAKALWEASGKRWPFNSEQRVLPNRIIAETRVTFEREASLGFAMAKLLRVAVEILDQELDERKHSGNGEDHGDLQSWSDQAHDLLSQIGGDA